MPLAWILMAAGYLTGCVIGAFVAIKADVSWLTNLWTDPVDKSASDLLSTLCGYGAYGFGMLLLSTSYLGFLLIPGVLSAKGFLSGSVFTVCLRGGAAHGLIQAITELLLPGVFLLPALLILGQLCMGWSVRLFRCRSGEALPPGPGSSRALGMALILLLLASAMKTYAVPYLLELL